MPYKFTTTFIFFFGLCFFLQAQNFEVKKLTLKASNYVMYTKVDYDNNKLISTCELTVTNPSNENIKTIPLLLYRLMKVTSIKDENGNRLSFTQRVMSFEDWEVYQVNFIEVELSKPIQNNGNKKIVIEYSGHLLGYTETGMSYVKDKISPEFTIIRPDCVAYPSLGYPSFEINRAAGFENFDYTVHITVPDSLVVANGGKLIGKTKKNGFATYSYKNIKPAWRIDLAIANYNIIQDGNIKVFYFPKDSTNAKRISKTAHKTIELYNEWFGKLNNFEGFSIIEIPDNWGSQADVTSIIQSAAAFHNSNHHYELYHEISHLWNVQSGDEYSPRWNEGLAMFLQYLTTDHLEGKNILTEKTNAYIDKIKASEKYKKTPLIDFGKGGVAGYSYTMGMVMFHVLYELVGEKEFNSIIKTYYTKYNGSKASTNDFIKTTSKISSKDLSTFFKDWVYSTNYTELIEQYPSIKELSNYYKK